MKSVVAILVLILFSCNNTGFESEVNSDTRNPDELNQLSRMSPRWFGKKKVKHGERAWYKVSIPYSIKADILEEANGRPLRYKWKFFERRTNLVGKRLTHEKVLSKNYTYVVFPTNPALYKVEILVWVGCEGRNGSFVHLGAGLAYNVDVED